MSSKFPDNAEKMSSDDPLYDETLKCAARYLDLMERFTSEGYALGNSLNALHEKYNKSNHTNVGVSVMLTALMSMLSAYKYTQTGSPFALLLAKSTLEALGGIAKKSKPLTEHISDEEAKEGVQRIKEMQELISNARTN